MPCGRSRQPPCTQMTTRVCSVAAPCAPPTTSRGPTRPGHDFLVCPGIFPDTIEAAAAADLPILPGVATPTEVELAQRLGCSVQKFFPAGVIGPRAISALLEPYPEVALVAVGAIRAQETASYLAAVALGVGLGSALADPEALAHLTETLTHLRRDHP